MIFELIVRIRSKKYGYPIIKISQEALTFYKQQVLECDESIDRFILQRKICRAWYLGHTVSIVAGIVHKRYKNINIYYDFAKMEIYNIEHDKECLNVESINVFDKKVINDLYCLVDRGDF